MHCLGPYLVQAFENYRPCEMRPICTMDRRKIGLVLTTVLYNQDQDQ